MLMEYPLKRCCDVIAFLPFLAMMEQCRNTRRFQKSRFLLLQRPESSKDQGSGYTKMVSIPSNVVNVKIKDILSFDYSLEGILTACWYIKKYAEAQQE